LHQLTIILGKLVLSGCFEESRVQEELIYLICQNNLGRGKEKGRREQKRRWKK
jgi:hypothetical protein